MIRNVKVYAAAMRRFGAVWKSVIAAVLSLCAATAGIFALALLLARSDSARPMAAPAPMSPVPVPAAPVSVPTVPLLEDSTHLPCDRQIWIEYDNAGAAFDINDAVHFVAVELARVTGRVVAVHAIGTGRVTNTIVFTIHWVPTARVAGDSTAAWADMHWRETGHGREITGGAVSLVADNPGRPGTGPGSEATLLAHEVGHLLDLAHSRDRAAVMFPILLPTRGPVWSSAEQRTLRWVATCS